MYPLLLVWAGQVSHGCWLPRHELGTEQGNKWGAAGGVEPWWEVSVCLSVTTTLLCQADLERGAGSGSWD